MKTVSKRFFLIAIAAVALLLGVFCLGLNYYLSTDEARVQMESAVQKALGAPVKIGGVHFNPWSGLVATDIQAAGASSGASSVSLPSISAQMAYGPLLSGRVVLKRLLISEPSLLLAQNAKGEWDMPLGKPTAEPAKAPKKKAAHGGSKGPEFNIQLVKLENARIRFVDKKGRELGLVEGVMGNFALEGFGRIAGNIEVQKVTLKNGLVFEAFRTPFKWEGDKLTLSPMDVRLAEGSIGGAATVGTGSGQPPFTLDLHFDGVNLTRLMTELGSSNKNGRSSGTFHGNLDLYGILGNNQSIQGTGHAWLRGARMEQIPLVQMIGSALQMEMGDIEVRQAQLDTRVGEEKIYVDSLVIESSSISLKAQGTSAFDGKLDLAARMAVSPKVSRQLPGWVNGNFQPVAGGDWRDIGFSVKGTLARPETDLLQVMVGRKLGDQFMNLLQAVTGKNKKKSGDKKKSEPEPSPEQEEPSSQPSATP